MLLKNVEKMEDHYENPVEMHSEISYNVRGLLLKNIKREEHRQIMKKIAISLMLVLALVFNAAAAVSAGTVKIGGNTASVVYVTTDSSTLVAPIIPSARLGSDASAASIISAAPDKVVAAMNGNFFNSYYTEPQDANTNNYPQIYGALVIDGKMINSGGAAALGVGYDGSLQIGRVEIKGQAVLGGVSFVAWGVNTHYNDASAVYILTDEFELPLDISSDFTIVLVSDGHVKKMISGQNDFVTPDGYIAVVIGSGYGTRGVEVGDTAEYTYTVTSGDSQKWSGLRNIIGASGMLVENGKNVVDLNSNVTEDKQNPDLVSQRTFVALLSDGRMMMGAVTSSFRTIADSLISMGATDAIFLDGGASTMLYCNGSYRSGPGRDLASVLAVMESSSAVTQAPTDEPSSWAATYVSEARSLGILPAELDKHYQQNITRGEFCQLIAAFMDICGVEIAQGESVKFTDTSDKNTLKVASAGIVTGYTDGTFKPGDSIKRQDAAIMLQRLATAAGMEEADAVKTFSDSASISAYAKPGVDYVTSVGIMNGNADGTFAPANNITREQAVITLINLLGVMEQG